MVLSGEEMRELGYRVVDMLVEHFDHLREKPFTRKASQQESSACVTVYAFGTEEHFYSGSGVNQGNIYYYDLGGMLVGEFDETNTNMFLTDTPGSVLETISAAPNSAAVQGNQMYGPAGLQGEEYHIQGYTSRCFI